MRLLCQLICLDLIFIFEEHLLLVVTEEKIKHSVIIIPVTHHTERDFLGSNVIMSEKRYELVWLLRGTWDYMVTFVQHAFCNKCFTKISLCHHENMMPIQYTVMFQGCENDYFQMKNCDIFLIFAQNIDRGYTLEPPQ